MGDCDPTDIACVQAMVASSVAQQQRTGEVEASADYSGCIAEGVDAATCAARWPSGYSGEIPFNSLTPQQQQAQMASPVQAAVNYLQVPNVASELKQFQINPAGLIPTDVPQVVWNVGVLPSPPSPAPAVTPPATPSSNLPPRPVVVTPPATTPTSAPTPGTPGGPVVIASSGVSQPVSSSLPTIAGFDLSSIPWWGWGIAAGGLLLAFGGGRGR